MRYYVVADIHGFYSLTIKALEEKGFFDDKGEKKLVICGDMLDRGDEPKKLQSFILDLLSRDEVILIRGNHEDLMEEMIENLYEYLPALSFTHHSHNGTLDTAMTLTKMSKRDIEQSPETFRQRAWDTPYMREIIPSSLDYYETENYIFVHGYIPCEEVLVGKDKKRYFPLEHWREAGSKAWERARWINGMDAWKNGGKIEGKTIVCGHFHSSWGHANLDGKGSEWGEDAIFTPYIADGIISLDSATPHTKMVSCIVIED
ncbi:MAG: metallophosphoesterase [Clostridia bacterium]|nr:metallophosphoesterase [Clostridia bacterium]